MGTPGLDFVNVVNDYFMTIPIFYGISTEAHFQQPAKNQPSVLMVHCFTNRVKRLIDDSETRCTIMVITAENC